MFAMRFLRRNGGKRREENVVEAPRSRLKRVGGRPYLKFKETAKVMPKKKSAASGVQKDGGGQDGTFESAASGVEKDGGRQYESHESSSCGKRSGGQAGGFGSAVEDTRRVGVTSSVQ